MENKEVENTIRYNTVVDVEHAERMQNAKLEMNPYSQSVLV